MPERQRKLWHIYHVSNAVHTNPPKNKFVVIAYREKSYYGFFINSEISAWLQNRPEHLTSVVKILASEHACLVHDSFVDCSQIFDFFDWELSKDKGEVSAATKQNILKAIDQCTTIEQKHRKAILKAAGLLPDDS